MANLKPARSTWKMLFDFLRLFFSLSSIHGFNHITRQGRHPLERFIWIVLVASAIYATGFFSTFYLDRYHNNPTVISMERDRFSFNTSFPSATICPTTKVNEELLDSFLEKSALIKDKVLYRKFVVSLLQADFNNLDEIVDYQGISGEELLELVLKFKFNFEPKVSNSAMSEKELKLQMTITEMGVCYSFNSQLAIYNSAQHWFNGTWDLLPDTEPLYLSPLDGEVFANVINMSTGYKMYLHGPYEVVDFASRYYESPAGYFAQLYVSGLTIFSSDKTKGLRVEQRKCRFYYESNLRYSPVYSYVLCRMECRANLALRLCGCLPYFYRKLDGDKTCDVPGLHCLAKHKEKLINLPKGECSCVANCDEVTYFIEELDTREWFLGTNLQWGLMEYPKMRLRRDVLFGFTDLLVYIGGLVGLLLGCSVLSLIEILYFFTIRLYWFVVNYKKSD